jgi:glycosyltransferase involved in cell wall biosynthesis
MLYVTDQPPPEPLDGVEVKDLVTPDRVSELYGRASVFVNPTRAEGYGFTNVEAQGFAMPVISTRIAAIPEVVDHGVTGLLVPPGDAEGLAAAMVRLAESRALRAEMGAAARSRFERLFTLRRFQADLRALYDEALARARAA